VILEFKFTFRANVTERV
jgi:hypothetical protein